MNLKTIQAKKWLEQNVPEQALTFLEAQVSALTEKAASEKIMFKGKVEMTENEINTATEPVVEPVATEAVVEKTIENEAPDIAQTLKSFQDGIAQSIVVALKEYHQTVVNPLLTEIESLKTEIATRKNFKQEANLMNVFYGASDFMPAAAVSELMKKEFGVASSSNGDIVATPEDVKHTIVKEKQVTEAPSNSGNMLAGF